MILAYLEKEDFNSLPHEIKFENTNLPEGVYLL